MSSPLSPRIHEASPTVMALGSQAVPVPLITHSARENSRPFLHPLRSPDGRHILTENEPPHHPWQHGLYIGLNDVNGLGFWTEGKKENRRDKDGCFRSLPLNPPRLLPDGGVAWKVETDYLDHAAQPLLQQCERWTARFYEDHYVMDLSWQLTGSVDVKIGLYTYGGLFLRVPFEKDQMALLTSEGAGTNVEAEGRPARWVAVANQAQGAGAALAILSHPTNQPHPELWRVDTQYGIGPCPFRSAPVQIGTGETVSWSYRVVVFTGRPEASWLEQQHAGYAATAVKEIS